MTDSVKKILRIMGTRGVPASHGGFETFAEDFALYLSKKGWTVQVYCQVDGRGDITTDSWKGIARVNVPVKGDSPLATAIFDFKGIIHSLKSKEVVLTLGYNTAVLNILYRFCNVPNIINMDGIEWKRGKWSLFFKIWFFINETMACWIGNKLVADDPGIKQHLLGRTFSDKISVIPYAAPCIDEANESLLSKFNLEKGRYCILIARPEPENTILEVVKTFSRRTRNFKLVILGSYSAHKFYQASVLSAASEEVIFLGAIYDKADVQSLRFYARFYIHGHTVGGTNPSLVEALGVGSAVLAHDNLFNRWVTDNKACYFKTENDCDEMLSKMMSDDSYIAMLRASMRKRFLEEFTCEKIHAAYEALVESLMT